MRRRLILFPLLLLVFLPVAAQQPSAGSYELLLEKLKRNDRAIDFKALRVAYTETKLYSPYGSDREPRKLMFESLHNKAFDKTLENAEKLLLSNYLDLNGHFGALVAHRELGHAEKFEYHRFVFDGLLNSIKNSGDGKTTPTAMMVISTDEEYVLLNYLGLRTVKQALINENGHHYDAMTVVDPKTNQTSVYYFNIDKPFNWLGNSLKPK